MTPEPSIVALPEGHMRRSVGSFWTDQMLPEQREVIARLTRIAEGIDVGELWLGIRSRLEPQGHETLRHNWETPFRSTTVIRFSPPHEKYLQINWSDDTAGWRVMAVPDRSQFFARNSRLLLQDQHENDNMFWSEDGRYVMFPADGSEPEVQDPQVWQDLWILPWLTERSGVPLVMEAHDGAVLLSGQDFHLLDGGIVFRQDPAQLFRDTVRVLLSRQENRPILDWVRGVQTFNGWAVTRWLRGDQSLAAWRRAVAEVAGQPVIPEATQVSWVYCDGHYWIINTDDGAIWRLPKADLPPSAGDLLEAGTILGQASRIYAPTGRHGWWWRNIDWTGGMSLDSLGYPLIVPDAQVTLFTDPDEGFLRFHMQGQPDVTSRFFRTVAVTGQFAAYLRDFLTLDDEDVLDGRSFNPIDFFFSHWLGQRSVVVDLYQGLIPENRRQSVELWIKREQPLPSLLILRWIAGVPPATTNHLT